MSYKIKMLAGEADFDSLLIQKLECATTIPINERVFALGQLGINADSIFARVWSFECSPESGAELKVTLQGPTGAGITACVTAEGVATLTAKDEQKQQKGQATEPLVGYLTSYMVTGEDLQGEYWGAVFILPLAATAKLLGLDGLHKGDKILGNFSREGKYTSEAFEGLGELEVIS